MRFSIASVGILLTACATSGPTPQAAGTSSSDDASLAAPFHAILVTVFNSCGDSDEPVEEFFPDGEANDPTGVWPLAVWDRQTARAILNGMPVGIGWESGDREKGHWEHDLVHADGTRARVPTDFREYRIHDGDTDAWRWVTDECGAP